MNKIIAFAALLLFQTTILSVCSLAENTSGLQITRMSPEGNLDNVPSQMIIEFSDDVVSLGDLSKTILNPEGISITPHISCSWKWISTRSLSCFISSDKTLSLSKRYVVRIEKNIKLHTEIKLGNSFEKSFVTPRPTITQAWLAHWINPETPVIKVVLNQPIIPETLAGSIYFISKDSSEKVAANIIEDEKQDDDNDKLSYFISPSRPLAADTAVKVMISPGVSASSLTPYEDTLESGIEDREIFSIQTFPKFELLGISCYDLKSNQIKIPSGIESVISAPECDPMSPIRLDFSSPPAIETFKGKIKSDPPIQLSSSDYEGIWDNEYSHKVRSQHFEGMRYPIYLASGLKAEADYVIEIDSPKSHEPSPSSSSWWQRILLFFRNLFSSSETQTDSVDLFGRSLEIPSKLAFKTSRRKPNFEMPFNHAVLEKETTSDIPLYVNNINSATFSYSGITATKTIPQQKHLYSIPKVENIQFAIPMGIRSLLDNQSGFLYGTVSTDPEVEKYQTNTFTQITPFAVHFKQGFLNSLAWVTDLATGNAVSGAKIEIFSGNLTELSNKINPLATAITESDGTAIMPGSEILDPFGNFQWAWEDNSNSLILKVSKGKDIAILPLRYSFGMSVYESASGFISTTQTLKDQNFVTWGNTAQGIYRAGEKIQYKIYIRKHGLKTLELPEYKSINITIKNPKEEVVSELTEVSLNEFGAISGSFDIPKTATTGWYKFSVSPSVNSELKKIDPNTDSTQEALRVLVSDFTPSPIKIDLNISSSGNSDGDTFYDDLFYAGNTLKTESKVSLHSGGAFAQGTIFTSLTVEEDTFSPKINSFSDFTFIDRAESVTANISHYEKKDSLTDNQGLLKSEFQIPAKLPFSFGKIIISSAVKDDRGVQLSDTKYKTFLGTSYFLGIKFPGWLLNVGTPAEIESIVLDIKEKSVEGAKITLNIEREEVVTAQVKSAGSSYVTRPEREWVKVDTCSLQSSSEPAKCNFTPEKAGRYRVLGTVVDSSGRTHKSSLELYASGSGFTSWGDDSEYKLELVADKAEYAVGDTARVMVKLPYENANSLVTIERGGILEKWNQTLSSSSSIIEVPINNDSIPGVYLSVLVSLPRDPNTKAPEKLGDLDLGKPTTRLGYIALPVKDKSKQINITISTPRNDYRPGDDVPFEIKLTNRDGSPFEQDAELSLSVLDESVYYLLSNKDNIFNIYDGMYVSPSLDVKNFSLLTRLVGMQAFEKKGATPGGDGGVTDNDIREIKSYLAHWDPSLVVSKDGVAKGTIKLPDNITSWRFIAIASSKTDHFGNGFTSIKSSKPLEVSASLPNQLIAGDRAVGLVSIFNKTAAKKEIQFSATLANSNEILSQSTLSINQGERKIIKVPVNTANDTANDIEKNSQSEKFSLLLKAVECDGSNCNGEQDALLTNFPVNPAYVFEKTSLSGVLENKQSEYSLSLSQTSLAGSTESKYAPEMEVIITDNVIGDTSESFDYLANYPYSCLEQKTAKALGSAWFKNSSESIAATDSNSIHFPLELPIEYIKELENLQSINGGFSYYGINASLDDPYLSAQIAFAVNELEKLGYKVSPQLKEKLLAYLSSLIDDKAENSKRLSMSEKTSLKASLAFAIAKLGELNDKILEDLHQNHKEMNQEARIVFARTLLLLNKISEVDIILQDLMGSLEVTPSDARLKVAEDQHIPVLGSEVTANCQVASLLAERLMHEEKFTADAPLLLSKITAGVKKMRGSQLRWGNTQENVHCIAALNLVDQFLIDNKESGNVKSRSETEIYLGSNLLGVITGDKNSSRSFNTVLPKEFLSMAETDKVLTLKTNSPAPLFYQIRLKNRRPAESLPELDAGFNLKRNYSVLRNDNWIPVDKSNLLKRGDVVRVDLLLETKHKRFMVALKDPMAGAFEPIRSGLAGTLDTERLLALPSPHITSKNNNGITVQSFPHTELRDSEALFYSEELWPGIHSHSYLASVISSGEFMIPAALIEEMYSPEVFGRTEVIKIETTE